MPPPPSPIFIAGGAGFLGTRLAAFLAQRGHPIRILSRNPPKTSSDPNIRFEPWDGRTLGPWAAHLEHAAALINLAGRSVNCRYTAKNRRRIMDSRILSTHVLGEAIARCTHPPVLWLNSSTATIYKHTYGPPHDESGPIGSTPEARDAFSIEVAIAWERTFFDAPISPATRRIALRTAIVLGNFPGTVFPILRRLTRLGLGGRVGDGRQFVSWLHELDFCRAIEWTLSHPEISGILNLAAPTPVTNAHMMQLFRETCGTPLHLPSPPAPRWLLEIAAFLIRTETELLLKSRHVIPTRLLNAGFQFQFPELRRRCRIYRHPFLVNSGEARNNFRICSFGLEAACGVANP